MAISAALFTALRGGDASLIPLLSRVFLGKTSNIDIRFAAGVALLFNLFMVVVAFAAIAMTVPEGRSAGVSGIKVSHDSSTTLVPEFEEYCVLRTEAVAAPFLGRLVS